MEQKSKEKAFFNNSEEISQISVVDGSIDQNKERRSQSPSQSLLQGNYDVEGEEINVAEHSEDLFPPTSSQPMSIRKSVDGENMDVVAEHSEELFPSSGPSSSLSILSKKSANSEENMDVVAEHSEELFTPSSVSLFQEIDNLSQEPIVKQKSNITSAVDKLLKETAAQSSENSSLITDNNQEDSFNEPDSEELNNDVDIVEDPETIEEVEDVSDDEVEEESEKQINEEDRNVVEMVGEEIEDEASEDTTMSLKTQLPLSKVKKIIKGDAENNLLINKEAVYVASIAAELFIANLTQQTAKITHSNKKKTMSIVHLKAALAGDETFDFLEGCFPEIY